MCRAARQLKIHRIIKFYVHVQCCTAISPQIQAICACGVQKIRTVVPPHKVHSLPQPRVPRIKADNTGIMSTMKRVPQPPLHRMGSSTAGAVVLNGV